MIKSKTQSIQEYVARSTPEEIVETIRQLLDGTRAGISGMKGESWLGTSKPTSKKAAIESALQYCEIINSEVSKKIF